MPREPAAERLTALIDALPCEPASAIPLQTSAADLVALLPKGQTPNVRSSDDAFALTGLRRQQIVMAFGAFVIMMLIVFAISALFSPGPGTGADLSAPRAADNTTMAPSRKLDP
jgi:hypothetical protein